MGQVSHRRLDLLFILFFVSGFSGLIYESVWSHYVKLFLGHAAYAQTLVLVVFIGGLAIGAAACARYANRIANPLRTYALIEGAIGLAALFFHPVFIAVTDWGFAVLLPQTCHQTLPFCAPQWLLSTLLLLPQSILLGATFPLMSSAVLRLDPSSPGHHVSMLYFFNSFGAVIGVLASGFLLVPWIGLPGTLTVAGVANLVIAGTAFGASREQPEALDVAPFDSRTLDSTGRRVIMLLLGAAFFTGLSSFIYEIAWIRMLSLVFGASTQSFELMLACFILGLAMGGLWIRSRIDTIADPMRYLAWIQVAMGLFAAASIPIYNGAFDAMAWLLSSLARNNGGYILFNAGSVAIALVLMLPATFCAGMTLPLITYRLLRSSEGERALGGVYAVNTLGSIVGVGLAVHLLLGSFGVRGTLIAGSAIDIAIGIALLAGAGTLLPRAALARSIAAVVAFALMTVPFDIDPRRSASGVFRTSLATLPRNETLIFHRDGKTATVDVVQVGGALSIRTNGKADASLSIAAERAPTGDEFTMVLLGLLPMAYQPEARAAAVIGLGSGMTSSVLLGSPQMQRVDTVEIEPAMVEGAHLFGERVRPVFTDPRSRIVIDDAKSFFARGRERYDIIVSEPSNPWVSGVSSLFTTEFYRRTATYLNDGGVLCQWLHTYEIDTRTLASILNAVATTYPDFALYFSNQADIVLVARKGAKLGAFDARPLAHPALAPILKRLELTDPVVVRRRLIGTWGSLGPFIGTYASPVNSDYFPVVDHWASRTRFTQVRADDFINLQRSGVPMMELLEGLTPPSDSRHQANPAQALVESATRSAWDIYDILLSDASAIPAGAATPNELGAHVLRTWMRECPADLRFAEILPLFVNIAEGLNPWLSPNVAGALWGRMRSSRCGTRLDAGSQRWLELIEATARRDVKKMVVVGAAVLETTTGKPSAETEYAFFATVTGLVAMGETQGALKLLQMGPDRWVRPGEHYLEARFLEATINAREKRSP